jgi:hypothetical protein
MQLKLKTKIEIPRRHSHCAVAQEELLPGSVYYSLLVDEVDEEAEEIVVRYDFCEKCWKERNRQDEAYWKAIVPPHKPEKEDLPADRDERAVVLFKNAIDEARECDVAASEAFVLGLYLARRRIITLRQELPRDGNTYLVYELQGSEEMLTLEKMDLQELDIIIIQKKLAEKFRTN